MRDGMLLVTQPEVIDYTSATAARELLGHCGHNVLGVVVNGVLPENEPDSYFYYVKGYSLDENATTREQAMSNAGNHAAPKLIPCLT